MFTLERGEFGKSWPPSFVTDLIFNQQFIAISSTVDAFVCNNEGF